VHLRWCGQAVSAGWQPGPRALVPLGLLALLTGPATAATVLSVGDGDTFRVVEGSQRLTIRMACIDAPDIEPRPEGSGRPGLPRSGRPLYPLSSHLSLK
jgi:endonuclease YncB( thermonuclease family)